MYHCSTGYEGEYLILSHRGATCCRLSEYLVTSHSHHIFALVSGQSKPPLFGHGTTIPATFQTGETERRAFGHEGALIRRTLIDSGKLRMARACPMVSLSYHIPAPSHHAMSPE